jgi:hypothetical protein
LLPGRYSIECWMSRKREQGDLALHVMRLLDFHVYGTKTGAGNIYTPVEVEATLE